MLYKLDQPWCCFLSWITSCLAPELPCCGGKRCFRHAREQAEVRAEAQQRRRARKWPWTWGLWKTLGWRKHGHEDTGLKKAWVKYVSLIKQKAHKKLAQGRSCLLASTLCLPLPCCYSHGSATSSQVEFKSSPNWVPQDIAGPKSPGSDEWQSTSNFRQQISVKWHVASTVKVSLVPQMKAEVYPER